MTDNLKNITSIPALEISIRYLQAYDRVNKDFLPHCKMDVTFADGRYQGRRIVNLDSPKITITQEGVVPLDQLKFGDFAKDFYYTPNTIRKKSSTDREISDKIKAMTNELIQGIHSDTYANFYPGSKYNIFRIIGSVGLCLENDGHILFSGIYEGVTNRFDYYIKKRRILTKEMELQGGGWIRSSSNLKDDELVMDDPLSNTLKRIYRQFHAETSRLSLIHIGEDRSVEIPVEYEQEVNPSDLVLYLALKKRGCLALLNKVLPLLSKTRSITYASSTVIQADGEEKIEGPIIINLEDGGELELWLSQNEYDFLIQKDVKRLLAL